VAFGIAVASAAGLPGDVFTAKAAAVPSSPTHVQAGALPRWYARTSPWNTPIGSSPAVAAQSSAWISAVHSRIHQININQRAWTPTVASVSRTVLRKRVTLADGWVLDDVPIPDSVVPSLDTDGHAMIVDASRSREYDFFQLRRGSDGQWSASSGVVLRLNGSGWYNGRHCARGTCGPWGARASSAALGGGLIRVTDVAAGMIPHALACAAPNDLIGPPESPATTGDGTGGRGAMPMGSRIQLDPSLDVSSLGLEPGEEMIARAFQIYGAYIVDSSSAFACHAQNSSTLGRVPYPASWLDGISRELVSRMRVVLPPPSPQYDSRAVFGQPHRRR
jgi:hypothetical protein